MKIARTARQQHDQRVHPRRGPERPALGFDPGVGFTSTTSTCAPQAALLEFSTSPGSSAERPAGHLVRKNTIAGALKYVTRDIDGPATLTASVTAATTASMT